ncbi:histidinol-phosphate transaminase [Shimazuella kribbensis]|uniref:histidinol-phosphate transaminase n=1 Tax=Shimazuella kribbensis TaxID=139808 RepID=UPI0012EC5308|nr:histidinol-phosphate transaminase [Shimazuella kribbensis]
MSAKKSIQGLPIYQPGKSLEEVKRELGLEKVIKLASNENPFGCSPKVWEALTQIKEQFHLYPEDDAPMLRKQLAESLEVDERRLVFGNGSDEVIQMIARAYLESGIESVMATPTFPRYGTATRIEGAVPVEVPLKDGKHDLDAMLAAVTEKTRLVWICNPNNPSGTFVDHDALNSFIDQLPEHVLVVIDEAYFEYVTDDSYPDSLSLLDYNPRIIVLRTFSKIYGLASFRAGYGIAHPEVIQQLSRVREPFNLNRLAQAATLAALKDETFVVYCRNQNRLGMKQVMEQLDEWNIDYYPSQANFLLIDTGYDGDEAFSYLLKQGVIVRSGKALGFPTYLRVTIGKKEENEAFLIGLNSYLQEKKSRVVT